MNPNCYYCKEPAKYVANRFSLCRDCAPYSVVIESDEKITSLDTRISSLLASLELELDAGIAAQKGPKGGQHAGPPKSAFCTIHPPAVIRIRRFVKNVRKEIERC